MEKIFENRKIKILGGILKISLKKNFKNQKNLKFFHLKKITKIQIFKKIILVLTRKQ